MIAMAMTSAGQKEKVVLATLGVGLVFVFLISLGIGQIYIPLGNITTILLKPLGFFADATVDSVHETVLWSIRLPRLVMTVLVGAALAVSGASLQGLFRNPLVEPGLIGVSTGSALAVVVLIVFGGFFSLTPDNTGMHIMMPLFAFSGGLLSTVLVVQIARFVGQGSIAILILCGVAVNALAGALMGLAIFYADDNQLRMFTFWTLGDLSGASWQGLAYASPLLLISSLWLLTFQNDLNAIALGESEAFHVGVNVPRVKKAVVFFCALAVGASVSLAGAIGFIGLVVPHLIRVTFHADNRLVLPASILGGPILLILADLAARTIVAPSELPIGVVTALVGAPFFIFLLIRSKKKKELIS
jgi:iron complex transport system permease protein